MGGVEVESVRLVPMCELTRGGKLALSSTEAAGTAACGREDAHVRKSVGAEVAGMVVGLAALREWAVGGGGGG